MGQGTLLYLLGETKFYASQVAGRVSGSVVEWMGGMGFVRGGIAEKMWRDSKIDAIYKAAKSTHDS